MTQATKPLDKKKTIDDCISRRGYKCLKLDKPVSVDARDPEQPSCWERQNCEFFEVKK